MWRKKNENVLSINIDDLNKNPMPNEVLKRRGTTRSFCNNHKSVKF